MFSDQFAGKIQFGQLIEVDPMVGLLDMVSKSAGFIGFIEDQIRAEAGLGQDVKLTEECLDGRKVPAVLVTMWGAERDRLARFSRMALDAGVQQKQLDLFVSYRDRVLDVLEAVLTDLGHDVDAPSVMGVVGRRLAIVAGQHLEVEQP